MEEVAEHLRSFLGGLTEAFGLEGGVDIDDSEADVLVATVEGHHPELLVRYGSCEVSYSTNAIGGLSDNDFICAAKVDRLAADS